jgi:hypothetical protein
LQDLSFIEEDLTFIEGRRSKEKNKVVRSYRARSFLNSPASSFPGLGDPDDGE